MNNKCPECNSDTASELVEGIRLADGSALDIRVRYCEKCQWVEIREVNRLGLSLRRWPS